MDHPMNFNGASRHATDAPLVPDDSDYMIHTLTASPMTAYHGSSIISDDQGLQSSIGFAPPSSDANLYMHKFHDDGCIENCPGIFDQQGLPVGTLQPLASSRPRMATTSFQPSVQTPQTYLFDNMAQFGPFDLNLFSPVGIRSSYNYFPMPRPNTAFSVSAQQLGNHFDSSNLGPVQHGSIPEDRVSINHSQNSCSSSVCCSTQVCQDEYCRDGGTPCDNLDCLRNPSQDFDRYFDIGADWSTAPQGIIPVESHGQPCNHTNTEHDVALTLRDLSAPGVSNLSQQSTFPVECHIFSQSPHSTDQHRSLSASVEPQIDPLSTSQVTLGSSISKSPQSFDSTSFGGIQASSSLNISSHNGRQTLTDRPICKWMVDQGHGQSDRCGRVFDDAAQLNEHLYKDHIALTTGKSQFCCMWDNCDRASREPFSSRNKLRRHCTTHTSFKPFKCEECNISFSAQQALDQHRRIHTGEKPFLCPFEGCTSKFRQQSALTMHIRTHTGEKPLQCEICGKSFGESSNLSKHRATHKSKDEHKYRCGVNGCTSKFRRLDQLKRHQACHARQLRQPSHASSSSNHSNLHSTIQTNPL